MKKIICLIAMIGAPFSLFAQAPGEVPHGQPGRERVPRERVDRERPPRGQPMLERWMNHLERENPEEHARLNQLREEDPAAFREEVRQSFARAREQTPRGGRGNPFAEEVEAIREAQTDEEREAAVQQFRQRVEERVEQRIQWRERRIEAVRAQLEELENQHKKDRDRREDLVKELMESLLEQGEE